MEDRKRLEEIMVALSLCFMGKDGYKARQTVTGEVERLCLHGPVWNGRLIVNQESAGSNPAGGAAEVV